MSEIITNTCPRGGFFDGNEDFGGPPYRGFMALLCFAPSMFIVLSSLWWFMCYRKQRREALAAASAAHIQNGNINVNLNYQSMNHPSSSSSSSTTSPSSSSSLVDMNIDDHPMIDTSLYCENDQSSPYTSSVVAPSMSPESMPAPSSSPLSSSITASLLTSSSSSSSSTSSSSSSSSFNIDNSDSSSSSSSIVSPSPVSGHTKFLLFCRSLIRPIPLFYSTFIYSCIQFILTLISIIYGISSGEQCCYGGTGALYAILVLRLSLSYSNIRVAYWQTNSRNTKITVIDKSCQIGYLIHFIWLSFAFILIADDGQCSKTAPVMYIVSFISIILLLINYIFFSLFTVLSYIYESKSDLIIVLSRCIIKYCLIGWSYGRELDLNDAITDIEMEIACLPCISYDDMMIREKNKKIRREMYDINNQNKQLVVKIDNMNTNDNNNDNEKNKNNINSDAETEALSCAICLSVYECSDMIRPLPCGHHLHKSCSDSWLKVKSTCPLCVRSVLVQ